MFLEIQEICDFFCQNRTVIKTFKILFFSLKCSSFIQRLLHTLTENRFQIEQQLMRYRNDPKFSDRYAWANSADPDQTAPRGAV